jgi:Ca-activated chloride channel family protein
MQEGDKMGKAQAALRKALDELRPEDTFNIVTFAERARSFSSGMRQASSANVSQGHLHINLMKPDGPTNMSAALDLALSQSDVTHIFLLSDGEPTEGTTNFDLLRLIVRQKNAGRCRIITLALGRGEHFKGMDLLRGIADDNNGRFDYVNLSR